MIRGNSRLRLWGDFYKVPVSTKAKISTEIEDFFDKINNKCQHIELSIKLEEEQKKFAHAPAFTCRTNLFTNIGRFSATSNELGSDFAVKHALEQLQSQLFRKVGRQEEFERYMSYEERLRPFVEEEVLA